MSNTRPWSRQPRKRGNRMRCAEELIGRNSVMPWTMARTTACSGVNDPSPPPRPAWAVRRRILPAAARSQHDRCRPAPILGPNRALNAPPAIPWADVSHTGVPREKSPGVAVFGVTRHAKLSPDTVPRRGGAPPAGSTRATDRVVPGSALGPLPARRLARSHRADAPGGLHLLAARELRAVLDRARAMDLDRQIDPRIPAPARARSGPRGLLPPHRRHLGSRQPLLRLPGLRAGRRDGALAGGRHALDRA